MADYRVYIRDAAAFNGATVETAIYAGTGYKFTTATNSAVGIFSPTSIGRFNVASLIQVFSDSALVGGDTVTINASTGVVRQAAVFGPAGSGWLFAEPDDTVRITAVGAGRAEIVVNDLNDDQLSQFVSAQIISAASAFSFAGTPVVSAANQAPSATLLTGKITPFQMTGLAGQDLLLPSVSAMSVGSQVVVFNSSANAHTVSPTGADLIDGVNAPFASAAGSKIVFYAAGSAIGWIAIVG